MRIRVRLSWCLWVVALVAAFLGGIRIGEKIQAARDLHLHDGYFIMLGD